MKITESVTLKITVPLAKQFPWKNKEGKIIQRKELIWKTPNGLNRKKFVAYKIAEIISAQIPHSDLMRVEIERRKK